MSEIERRFLVDQEKAPLLQAVVVLRIDQGYLAIDDVAKSSVRVRRTIVGRELTVKAGTGVERAEVPIPLSVEDCNRLWPLTEGARVQKRRHRIPASPHTFELDVFEERHEGLMLVEVEFETREAAAAFDPPDWFGREVTDDHRYTNAWLARYGVPELHGA